MTAEPRPLTVVIFSDNGQTRQETWTPKDNGSVLEQLQGAVGGLVDVVVLQAGVPGLDMWLNDDGMYDCDPNPAATVVARAYGLTTQPYFGPAVFTSRADDEGTTLGLTNGQAEDLLAAAETVRGTELFIAAANRWRRTH